MLNRPAPRFVPTTFGNLALLLLLLGAETSIETAFRLGGKAEREARRMGSVELLGVMEYNSPDCDMVLLATACLKPAKEFLSL